MTDRKRRKKNTLRGHRYHGAGNVKNRRGAGCRGGRGKAGSHKHKYVNYHEQFGKHGFIPLKRKNSETSSEINLRKLADMIIQGKIPKDGEKYLLDKTLGYDKILGQGNIEHSLHIKGIAVSSSAKEKIEKAGGIIEWLG